jgi:hypothetical protein
VTGFGVSSDEHSSCDKCEMFEGSVKISMNCSYLFQQLAPLLNVLATVSKGHSYYCSDPFDLYHSLVFHH